jgi:transcriptional regulator with XRE-family HTH domain
MIAGVQMSGGFASRLRELRLAANMTQEALARAASVSNNTVSKLEQGAGDPSWNTVRTLAKALGVSVAAFEVEDTVEPEPPAEPAKPDKPPKRRPKK